MRQNQNPRRSRGRINNGRNQNGKPVQDNNQQNRRGFSNSNRQFESQGPDGKNRGTASQLYERYTALSREVISLDRTLAEAFSQFADHYYRVAAEAGFEAESAKNRDMAQTGSDVRADAAAHQPPRSYPENYGNNIDNGNVAVASEMNFSANAEEPQSGQPRLPRESGDGEGRESSDSHWGNSRRRRAQNYREARVAVEEASPRPAAPVAAPAPTVVEPSVTTALPEIKPRRRISRPLSSEGKSGVAEDVPQASPVSAPLMAEEAPKPRRGRPRKVLAAGEPVL
jgi:hypothetical protein